MSDARRQRPDWKTARPKRTLSVRVRLMILALIAVVPLLGERIYNEKFDRAERIEAAFSQARDLARQGAAEQNAGIVATRALLQTVASTRAAFQAPNSECNRFLATIAKSAPWINTVSVADPQGRIFCTSSPRALGLDISDRAHFSKALDSADFVVSDYYVGTRVTTPLMTLALAQRDADGSPTAVVLGLLDLRWFEHVAKIFVPPSGSMLMIDANGTVLARYPNGDWVGRGYKDQPLIKAMLARPEGLVAAAGLDGVRRIFGYVQLPGTQARIAVGLDETTVLARANREMWTALTEVGLAAMLVLLSIWFGGEKLLVRPIRALANTAGRIGRGEDKGHAGDLPWAAEFVPLAAALDDMADKLSEREQELRDSNNQLRELAQIDALTGLANRRAFNERLMAEWKLAVRLRQPIAVLMIDVDHFKPFNDVYGHVQGDACLRKVAGVLMAGTRSQAACAAPAREPTPLRRTDGRARDTDFAARYGGEEFAVLLPGADLEAALHVAERLRAGIENLLIAHSGAPWGFVSVSVGAASASPSDKCGPQELTESADAALYRAKWQGRNRVFGAGSVTLSRAI